MLTFVISNLDELFLAQTDVNNCSRGKCPSKFAVVGHLISANEVDADVCVVNLSLQTQVLATNVFPLNKHQST